MDEISGLDWDIVPIDEYPYEVVEEGIKKVKDFFCNPNQNDESFSNLIRALLKDILEIDAGVIVKVFDINSYDFDSIEPKSGAPTLKPLGKRNLTEIYVRDGASFLKEIDKFGFLKGFWQYSYQIPAHPMWFNRDEIIYMTEHPRSMSCYGYARTQAILDIIKSLHYSTLYNKKFFEESPIPDGALSLLDTNETEMKSFMHYWNSEFKAQPHKVAVLNKDIKWQPFAVSQRELEFLETQKWYYNIVISGFGLTPSEMGITEDSNRAVAATQAELVKRKGIRPFLKLIEDYFNKELIPEFGFEGIEFHFIYDDPSEKKQRLENWQIELNMGIKTINEVRNELGLEPIQGGDVSNNMMSRLFQQQQQSRELPSDEEEAQSPGYVETLDREEGRVEGAEETKKQYNKINYDSYELALGIEVEREHAVSLQLTEEEIIQIALDHLAEDPKYYSKLRVMETKKKDKNLYKGTDDGQYYREQAITQPRRPSGAHFQPQNNLDYTDTTPSQLISSFADTEQQIQVPDTIHCPMCGYPTLGDLNAIEQLEDDYRCTNCGARFKKDELFAAPIMEQMYNYLQQYTGVNTLTPEWYPKYKSTSFKTDLDLDVKKFCGFDCEKSFPFANSFSNSTSYYTMLGSFLSDLKKDQVKNIISIITDSLKSSESIRDVANQINEVIDDPVRSELIARTEVIRVANEGNLNMMEEKGTEKVIFIAAPEDGRLCRKCAEKDGMIRNVNEAHGIIPVHPRCRCSWTEHIEL